jgi:hypothetical protein
VPQMIAATIIAKNPEKFGFKNVPYQPPVKMDKVQVNEPTSLRAAAFAVNMQADDIQLLNPELLRGVTPPDSSNYTLNLPPSSKDLFTKNITLARIEYPGVASRPVQTATRSNHHHQYYRKGQASHSAAAPVASKSSSKHVASAKANTKKAATYARKGKAPEAREAPAPAVQASLFGSVGASAKHGAAGNGKAKGKSQTVAKSGSKKPVEANLNKKGEAAKGAAKSKFVKKTNKSAGKAKDKLSKAKSTALFASAAK